MRDVLARREAPPDRLRRGGPAPRRSAARPTGAGSSTCSTSSAARPGPTTTFRRWVVDRRPGEASSTSGRRPGRPTRSSSRSATAGCRAVSSASRWATGTSRRRPRRSTRPTRCSATRRQIEQAAGRLGLPPPTDARDRVRGRDSRTSRRSRRWPTRQLRARGLAGRRRRPGVARAAAADGDRAAGPRPGRRAGGGPDGVRVGRRSTPRTRDRAAVNGDARRGGRDRAASGSRSRAWPGPASSRSAARRSSRAPRPADGRAAAGGAAAAAGARRRRRGRSAASGRRPATYASSAGPRHRLAARARSGPPAADGPDPYATLGARRPADGEPDPTADAERDRGDAT